MIKVWDEIINTFIIGTDKKQFNKQLLAADLLALIEETEQLTDQKEDQFLNAASVIYNYRRSGFIPSKAQAELLPVCEKETKVYCRNTASASLQTVLGEENNSLLYYWLLLCSKNELLAEPVFIPVLLDIAKKNKELRSLIDTCLGKRVTWVKTFNWQWDFNTQLTYKQLFEEGRTEERKTALIQWRNEFPSEAREALASVWKGEQAATKTELLETLEINLSEEDEIFLNEAWKEKSQKVKDVALSLLKKIPGSSITTEVLNFTTPLISYKKSSAMLGLVNKESIEIDLSFEIPVHFKTYGISNIDANKIFSEKEFTLNQLLSSVPPNIWETHFNLTPQQILELLAKKEETKKFIGAFAEAADTFKNSEWGALLYKKHNFICYSVIGSFSRDIQEEIALATLTDNRNIYACLPGKDIEWPVKFVMAFLERTSQEPYSYSKNYYKTIIHHFPVQITDKIDSIHVEDVLKKSYWENIKEEIKKMLAVKQQIIQSF